MDNIVYPAPPDTVKMLWYLITKYCNGKVSIPLKDLILINKGSIEVKNYPDEIQVTCSTGENEDALPG